MAKDRTRRGGRPPWHRPWEQQPGESAEEFGHFRVYLNLGPSRSLTKASQDCGLSPSRLKQLSVQWKWPFRALAWDRHQFLRRRREQLEACTENRERLLRESADLQRIAGMEFRSWVRRDERGELQLVRELSPSEAIRLWEVGCEALQELQGDAVASSYEQSLPRENIFGQSPMEVAIREAADAAASYIGYGDRSEIDQALRNVIAAWALYYCEHHPDSDSRDPDHCLWPWDMPYAEA
jgi:hypothetical protein